VEADSCNRVGGGQTLVMLAYEHGTLSHQSPAGLPPYSDTKERVMRRQMVIEEPSDEEPLAYDDPSAGGKEKLGPVLQSLSLLERRVNVLSNKHRHLHDKLSPILVKLSGGEGKEGNAEPENEVPACSPVQARLEDLVENINHLITLQEDLLKRIQL
jgi:hypothetical protein